MYIVLETYYKHAEYILSTFTDEVKLYSYLCERVDIYSNNEEGNGNVHLDVNLYMIKGVQVYEKLLS